MYSCFVLTIDSDDNAAGYQTVEAVQNSDAGVENLKCQRIWQMMN